MTEPKRVFFVNYLFCLLICSPNRAMSGLHPPIVSAVHNCQRYVNVDSFFFFQITHNSLSHPMHISRVSAFRREKKQLIKEPHLGGKHSPTPTSF